MRSGVALVATLILSAITVCASARPGDSADSTVVSPFARLTLGADVDSTTIILDGRVAGITPLALDSVAPGSHTVLAEGRKAASWFSKTDSMVVVLAPGETRHLVFSVVSPLRLAPTSLPAVSPLLRSEGGSTGRKIALYASGGVAIAAGIAAAYCKISADERNESYLRTGNPSLLDERRRLDTAAGIAFAATQIGFALFSYLLLTE